MERQLEEARKEHQRLQDEIRVLHDNLFLTVKALEALVVDDIYRKEYQHAG